MIVIKLFEDVGIICELTSIYCRICLNLEQGIGYRLIYIIEFYHDALLIPICTGRIKNACCFSQHFNPFFILYRPSL